MENFLFKLSIMLVPGLFAITCHEVSHGYIAWRYGDPTARMLGRLTLNPLKHIDIIGTLMIVLIGIGWAKPVPVVYENLRNPKRDMIWVAVAGPVTNLLLAFISAMLLRGIIVFVNPAVSGSSMTMVVEPMVLMLAFSVYINLLLAIFNMIPLPPLDGGRVLSGLLPYRQAAALARIEPYGMIIIIALVFFTNIFSYVILPFLNIGVRLLAGPQSDLVLGIPRLLMR
ncbi:MAG: site-2 protease family protein [Geobacteraceae bacterium]|nr:site-2 protease family protein [Geobacteraceae bacterium]